MQREPRALCRSSTNCCSRSRDCPKTQNPPSAGSRSDCRSGITASWNWWTGWRGAVWSNGAATGTTSAKFSWTSRPPARTRYGSFPTSTGGSCGRPGPRSSRRCQKQETRMGDSGAARVSGANPRALRPPQLEPSGASQQQRKYLNVNRQSGDLREPCANVKRDRERLERVNIGAALRPRLCFR